MQFSDFYTEIIDRVHQSSANATFLTKVKRWLNLARTQLTALNPDGWYWMAATSTVSVTGTTPAALAADFDKINDQEVRIQAGARLELAQDKDLEYLVTAGEFNGTTTGPPRIFRIVGYNKIQVFPGPAGATTIAYEYFKSKLADMSADTDTSGMPQRFEPLMLDLAEMYAQNFVRQVEKARSAYDRVLASIQILMPNNTSILKLMAKQIAPALVTDAQDQQTVVNRS
jgi:hypothetical protein